jgi:ATP-dependent DNA helicase UvrD/PcrA
MESRFVAEVPPESVEERFFGSSRPTVFTPFAAEDESQEVDIPGTGELKRGRRVRHPRYGYGVILAQEGSGDETRLTVYFDRAGKKKFMARYADLTPA